MGFKEWLDKPRLSDEEWRKQMAFVGKGVAIAVAGLWLLLVGTEYLDKRGKQLVGWAKLAPILHLDRGLSFSQVRRTLITARFRDVMTSRIKAS